MTQPRTNPGARAGKPARRLLSKILIVDLDKGLKMNLFPIEFASMHSKTSIGMVAENKESRFRISDRFYPWPPFAIRDDWAWLAERTGAKLSQKDS